MEFKEYKLADITEKIYSGGTPSTKEASYWNGELKWLSSGETSNRFIISTEKTITQKGVENSSTKLAFKNDLVMASAGQGYTRGQTSFLKIDTYINQSLIAISVNTDKVHPLYLFYNLISRYEELRQISDSSSTRGSINTKMIKNLNIMIPEKCYQNRIVYLINSIDEKIEINKKIIANLEELSQTLFKRWFVDFEFPDKAGNPYKSSGGEMIDSELGEIPKNWNILTINDFADDLIITGKTPSTKNKDNYSEKGIPFLTIPDMHTDVFSLNTIKYISEVGIEKVKNKIIPENSLCVSCIATPGLVSITSSETLTNQQINSFTPKKNDLYYLYFYIKNMKKYIEDLGSGGSATLNLNKTQFSKIKIIRPINDLLKKFHKCVDSNFKIILTKQKENLKLQELRDTLLPKLMSGELEIPDDVEVNTDELSI